MLSQFPFWSFSGIRDFRIPFMTAMEGYLRQCCEVYVTGKDVSLFSVSGLSTIPSLNSLVYLEVKEEGIMKEKGIMTMDIFL